ncbi:MAG: FGGY-family carbohydrate kinase [Thermoguttaceae bacterium]|nr:FGGY-family carbohydrate kinase [Thermoguttaceae bacterium]
MTILAYDLGTGGNKASLYAEDGKLIASVFEGYDTFYPKSGFHEQKPLDWKRAVVESTRKLFAMPGLEPQDVTAIALSGHSLGCVPLDADGELLLDSTPIWSDSRAETQAARFFETSDYAEWYRKTGAGFPPAHYTVFKLIWYRENLPEMFAKMKKFVGTKDFINYWLTGRVATDFSYASGTGAYALEAWDYDDGIIASAGLSREIFPEIVPSTEILGTLTPEAAQELGLPQNVQVAAGGVDNSCMALGARAFKNGWSYASLGSSSWIAVSDEKPLLDTKFFPYVFTHVVPGQFASATAIFSAGTTLKWIRDLCCGDLKAECAQTGENVYARMMELASRSPIGARGLLLNPTFAGGSCLEPSSKMRGGLFNLDLSHTREDVIRAALEGIALNLRKALDALGTLTRLEDSITLVGGGAISPVWRQIYADAFNKTVEKTNIDQEAAALGAAALAAVGTGVWEDFDRIDDVHETQAVTRPEKPEAYDALLPKFLETAEMLTRLAE